MAEMGDWFAEMVRQGVFTPATPEQLASVLPPASVPEAGKSDPALHMFDRADVKGDPAQHLMTRPGGEGPFNPTPAPPTPGTPAYPGAPPWAGDPNIPAPLANFLLQYASGHSQLPQEIYDLYGGDEILTNLQKFDPNASWSYSDVGGGEGATSQMGYKLNFDETKLPPFAGPGWQSPVSLNQDRLRNGEMRYYDPNYGWVTDPRNVYHKSEGIEKWAPAIGAAISMGAPLAFPAAFGALGAAAVPAGFTSGVTGAAAGLGAGNIPGSFASLGGPASATQAARPSTYTSGVRTVGGLGSSLRPPTAPAPRPPVPPKMGMTRPPIPKNQTMADPYGYDFTKFNAGGSTSRANNNDSKLVATQFADDPYRFS
jgi:hypothetical protein